MSLKKEDSKPTESQKLQTVKETELKVPEKKRVEKAIYRSIEKAR